MIVSIPLLALGGLLPAARAGLEGEISLLAGGRSAPETAQELPLDWDGELDPAALAALGGDLDADWDTGCWAGGSAAAWGYLPDLEGDLLALEPRGGWGMSREGWSVELGGRYGYTLNPWNVASSNARGELLAGGERAWGPHAVDLAVVGLDRRYPYTSEWNLRSAEAGLAWRCEPSSLPAWWRLGGSLQGNQGSNVSVGGFQHPASGHQWRAQAELGLMGRRWELQLGYRLYLARGGRVEEATRPQFTPLGAYSDDADALSAGGFLQQRLDLGGAVDLGDWTLELSALGRLRHSEPGLATASYARTIHGHLSARRELGERLALSATGGVNAARTVEKRSFTDVYTWLGLHWLLRPAGAQP